MMGSRAHAMDLEEYTARALALYAFPCPPLPLLVLRGAEGATELASSHDLLMTGLSVAQQRKSVAALERQRGRQEALLAWYNAELDARHAAGAPLGELYEVLQRYTRETAALYLERRPEDVDARFAPLESVCRGDLVHQRAAEFLSLHGALAGGEAVPLGELLALPYGALLRRFVSRHCAGDS